MHDDHKPILDLWDQYIAPLGPKPLNQFRRLTQNPLNDFATKFIWRYLVVTNGDPTEASYLCVSDTQKEWGRSQELALEIRREGMHEWAAYQPQLTFFTNSLLFGRKVVGPDGKEQWTEPSKRVWGGLPQCYTVEFDVKSLDFFREQLRWCRSAGKKPMDAPLGRVFEHFSRYADFLGITACWSGNKSIHIHVLFDSWMAVDRYRLDRRAMRPGFIAHWDDIHRAVKTILEVPAEIEADASLRFPEQFRRLPHGSRVVGPGNLLGIPEGTRVPQLTLWESLRERRAGDANELFHRPEPFLIGARPQAVGGIGGTINAGPLSEAERLHCEGKLREACRRAWGEWPRLYRLEYVKGEWVARFNNSVADTNPSSIMKEKYQAPYLCGRDARPVKGRLDRPMGVLIRMWTMDHRGRQEAARRVGDGHGEANDNIPGDPDPDANVCWIDPVRGRDLSDLEQRFQDGATTRDVVPALTRRAVVDAVVSHDFAWLKGPEGSGKTRGLMAAHSEIMAAIGATGRPSMYAFISYDNAAEKAAEFNAMQAAAGGRYHAVVIRAWEAEYREVCGRLKLTPLSSGAALAAGYTTLWRAVATLQPEALEALEKRHRAVWDAVGNRWPVWFTQHGLMQAWTTWTHSRRFWHRDFWRVWREMTRRRSAPVEAGERGKGHPEWRARFGGVSLEERADGTGHDHRQEAADRYDMLQAEMGLALAVHDEVAAHDILETRRADTVEWVQALKRAEPVWRKSGHTLDKYRVWDDLREAPLGLTFQDALQIAGGSAKAWRDVTVRDSGEYGPAGDHSIYSRAAGNRWMVRERKWWAGLARRVVATTTEVLPTLIAANLEPVTVLGQSRKTLAERRKAGWTVVELECPRLARDTVRVTFDRACTAANVPAVVERFRAAHGQDFFVITNKGREVERTQTHAGAKGSNGMIGQDIAQVMLHMGPDEHEFHEVLNGWLGVDVCIRLAHVDTFNQSAGRNLGFRKRGDDPHHWLVMSASLWLKICDVLAQYSRYDLRHVLSDGEVLEVRRRQGEKMSA